MIYNTTRRQLLSSSLINVSNISGRVARKVKRVITFLYKYFGQSADYCQNKDRNLSYSAYIYVYIYIHICGEMHKCFSSIDSRENAVFYFTLKPGAKESVWKHKQAISQTFYCNVGNIRQIRSSRSKSDIHEGQHQFFDMTNCKPN